MNTTVRMATFETNSSSSHALVWGDGSFECPYVLDVPEEPHEYDYEDEGKSYDDYLDDLYEWEQKRNEVFYMWNVPGWDPDPEDSNGDTLDTDVPNKLAALIYLIENYDSVASREQWAERINSMFVGLDVREWLGTGYVEGWGNNLVGDREAAEILEALSDDGNLARFLLDPETTIAARFYG